MESLLNYLFFESKNKIVAMFPWQQQITYSQTCKVNCNGLTMQLEIYFLEVINILWFFWLKTNVEQVI